ncbi:MAG: 50S ribosomal protein L32 [Oscillospiraceae bacterium]|nr:50S ribosomal protein L32 [Oscillospiraceae bacterium]
MAVPKRKVSSARRDKRRHSWKLAIPGVSACPKCGEPRLSHRACKACGYYNGREVVAVEESAK